MSSRPQEAWSSRLGAILAVAGSAVGIGNFIRFPALAAEYGGGAFMIAYFVSFLVIGIPLCWVEWTVGRMGGGLGFHSAAGILHAAFRRPWARYLGGLGIVIVVLLYFFYIHVESWCLGYAYHAAIGTFQTPGMSFSQFFVDYAGLAADGSSVHFAPSQVGCFLVLAFVINLWFVHRGISRGIEKVCMWGLPALIVLALVILVRVLTLGTPDPTKPDQNLLAGLGYLWNPGDVGAGLRNPQLWLAAAGQIFFSLSIGMGVIVTYASYLKKNDDIALSGLSSAAANEVCEVGLGGLITVPAAYVFLGATAISSSTVSLGFMVLPDVFARMPGGQFFAIAYFLLLFLAALTSSLSMLQPAIAFLEEALDIGRNASVAILTLVTGAGAGFVWWFSADLKALDTLNFWIATCAVYVQATCFVIAFGWIIGAKRGLAEARRGARMHLPDFVAPLIRYVCPAYLLVIFGLFVLQDIVGWNFSFSSPEFVPTEKIADLFGSKASPVAQLTIAFALVLAGLCMLLLEHAARRWDVRLGSARKPSTRASS
jgi:Na+-dependent transporters of the SNF family